MQRKKIILDCDLMNHPNSGLYHYCLNLGTYVRELLGEDGSASISFYVPPAEAAAFGPGSHTVVERKRLFDFLRPAWSGYDIWHAPFQSGRIIPDRKKNPRTKVLLTIHDLNPLHEGKPEAEQQKSLAKTQSLIDKSDAIVCISEFCRQDVLKNCDTGNKPVYVIHNGMHKVHPAGVNGIAYKPSRPFLFGLGYVNTKKNYHVLLPLLRNEQLELIIGGRLDEPDYIQQMKATAVQLGVADRLHILGPLPEHEKAWYYTNCYAFVHPSLAEGFGAPVVEVMQFGKPIFLSALTSLPEIGGDSAFYFSSFDGDHMNEVFASGMERFQKENMSDKVRQRGAAFDWKEKAKEYIAVYKTLY